MIDSSGLNTIQLIDCFGLILFYINNSLHSYWSLYPTETFSQRFTFQGNLLGDDQSYGEVNEILDEITNGLRLKGRQHIPLVSV